MKTLKEAMRLVKRERKLGDLSTIALSKLMDNYSPQTYEDFKKWSHLWDDALNDCANNGLLARIYNVILGRFQ